MQLSKDANKMIGVIYKSYLEKRKNGESKSGAKYFPASWPSELFPDMPESDAFDTLREIKRALKIEEDITGGFELSNDAIVYMENRFPDGLKSVLSFLALLKP